jgi:hypothetical protein
MSPVLIDLCCGAGGSAKGYSDAGFEIFGIDNRNQKHYPFAFKKADVLDLDLESAFPNAAMFHASPPCQLFCIGTKKYRNQGKEYPDVLTPLRQKLLRTGKPFVIENVPGAPMRRDVMLCGEMFNLRVIRHRMFEIHGFTVLQPPHIKHKTSLKDGSALGVYGSNGSLFTVGKPGYRDNYTKFQEQQHQPPPYEHVFSGQPGGWGKPKEERMRSYYATVAGNGGDSYSYTLENWQRAMGIDWMNKVELTQAIPPAYTRFLAQQIIHNFVPFPVIRN